MEEKRNGLVLVEDDESASEFQLIDAHARKQKEGVHLAVRRLWARFEWEAYGTCYSDFWSKNSELHYSLWVWRWGGKWYKLCDVDNQLGAGAKGAVYLKCEGDYHRVFDDSNGLSVVKDHGIQNVELAAAITQRVEIYRRIRKIRVSLYRLPAEVFLGRDERSYISGFQLARWGRGAEVEEIRQLAASVDAKAPIDCLLWGVWKWGPKAAELVDLGTAVFLRRGSEAYWIYDIKEGAAEVTVTEHAPKELKENWELDSLLLSKHGRCSYHYLHRLLAYL